MSIVVKIDAGMTKMASSPVTAPIESICPKFAALKETMDRHGASYTLGFGALASYLQVNDDQVTDKEAFLTDLRALDGIEAAYDKPEGGPPRAPKGPGM